MLFVTVSLASVIRFQILYCHNFIMIPAASLQMKLVDNKTILLPHVSSRTQYCVRILSSRYTVYCCQPDTLFVLNYIVIVPIFGITIHFTAEEKKEIIKISSSIGVRSSHPLSRYCINCLMLNSGAGNRIAIGLGQNKSSTGQPVRRGR